MGGTSTFATATVIVCVAFRRVLVEVTMTLSLVSFVALAPLSTATPVILLSPALQSLRIRTVKVPSALVSPGSVESAVPRTAPVVQVAPTRYAFQEVRFVASVS